MNDWIIWLRALGRAIWDEVPRAIVGSLPFGDNVYRIAERMHADLGRAQSPQQSRAAVEALASAPAATVTAAAQQIADEVAANQPPEVRRTLARTLAQAPEVIRRSLRRPDDPSGKTLPKGVALDRPAALVPMIPAGPPRFEVGQSLPFLNRWKLRRQLGSGGFAEVWEVCHPTDDDLSVAFKIFQGEGDRRRFGQHEVAVLRQVRKLGPSQTTGIVKLEDFDLDCETPWLRFECIDGGDLVNHAATFFGPAATPFILDLARIVARCHLLNPAVVHRDLKPSNVLMRREGNRLVPLVADFGIGGTCAALSLDQNRIATVHRATLPTELLGSHTILYASPGQRAGLPPDPRDDVFSLGVLWYQLLVGKLTTGAPTGNWQRRLKLAPDLVELLGDCLDHEDREHQPANADVLAQRLVAGMQPIPVTVPASAPVSVPVTVPVTVPVPVPVVTPVPTMPPKFTLASLKLPMVLVPPGEFWMGGDDGQCGETLVTIAEPFYLGVYPVTQAQWFAITGKNPSGFKKTGAEMEQFPVEQVTHDDVEAFLKELNKREASSGWMYRLPTEQEWEYSVRSPVPSPASSAECKARCSFSFYFDQPTNQLSNQQANFNGRLRNGPAPALNGLQRTTQVGSYRSNSLGIYDLHGNVWEWTSTFDSGWVNRGGGWNEGSVHCTAASRHIRSPFYQRSAVGFRLARVLSGQ